MTNSLHADEIRIDDALVRKLVAAQFPRYAALPLSRLGSSGSTIDLHDAREVLDAPARQVFRERLGSSDARWTRGRGRAFLIALGALPYYGTTMPGRRRDRLAMAMAMAVVADGKTG